MRFGKVLWAIIALIVAVRSAPVYAHSLDQSYGPFLGNLLHPLTSLDHGLAFLAIGLLAGQQKPTAPRWTVVAFLAGLLLGTSLPLLLTLNSGFAQLTTLNIASVVLLGVLVAVALPIPFFLAVVIGATAGLSHGFENSMDIAPQSRSLFAVAGVVTAGFGAAGLFAGLVANMHGPWLTIGVRVAGSWIAAIGLMTLGFQVR